MKTKNLTQEESITKSVSAVYDSVKLINELNLIEELSNEEEGALNRNKEHIKIMVAKEWFYNALTEDQKVELSNI